MLARNLTKVVCIYHNSSHINRYVAMSVVLASLFTITVVSIVYKPKDFHLKLFGFGHKKKGEFGFVFLMFLGNWISLIWDYFVCKYFQV